MPIRKSSPRPRLLASSACCWLLLSAVLAAVQAETAGGAQQTFSVPLPDPWLPSSVDLDGDTTEWRDVPSCCRHEEGGDAGTACASDAADSDADSDAAEEVCVSPPVRYRQFAMGRLPQFTTDQALEVLELAKKAWDGGSGEWTQMSLRDRCDAIASFFDELSKDRDAIVDTLMYEIGKNRPDAESEFDRTVQFARELIETIKGDPEFGGRWRSVGSTNAFVRRGAIGIVLALAPYNYPLNECYSTIIPALLMGNIVVLKIPAVGGLVHLLTMRAFRKALPPDTIHFIAGSGRKTMPPLMSTGDIDGLAFIGGSKAADDLIKSHPHPHRLKVFLQLEANNMAIYLPDLFDGKISKGKASAPSAALDNALDQAVVGSLSYNGQRCTALKLHFVPTRHAGRFAADLARRVEALPVGLPDEKHGGGGGGGASSSYSKITPLPAGANRVRYMRELIDDALLKGAKIVNEKGGTLVGSIENEDGESGSDSSTLMVPAVLYPVTSDMRIYHEEQFGPVVPIVEYNSLQEVLDFGRDNPFGQQVSIFGGTDEDSTTAAATIVDRFSSVFGRINLNVQCGRSPDTLPFAGRRSSAMGVMSVLDALKEFSVPTVVAYKESSSKEMAASNKKLARDLESKAKFMQPV